eukprot:6075342-Pyramimonas_sp.AAC.1
MRQQLRPRRSTRHFLAGFRLNVDALRAPNPAPVSSKGASGAAEPAAAAAVGPPMRERAAEIAPGGPAAAAPVAPSQL